MARRVSGTFRRPDRVRIVEGSTVRLVIAHRARDASATLLELGLAEAVLTDAELPPLGTHVGVAITLRGRYLEFELPGVVSWHRGDEIGVTFEYLTARQTYGLALAIDVMGEAAQAEAPAAHLRVARR